MSEIENDFLKIPDELIEEAVKDLERKWRIERLKEILSIAFGFILSILVVIGVFTLIYRVEYYFEWNVKNHYKVYLTVSFIITYFIISRAESIKSMHLIQNYSKPIFYFIFLFFALLGAIFMYDIFIKEALAEKKQLFKSNGIEMQRESYNTRKMCNYHLGKLYKKLENFAMYSDSENIIENIFRNSDIEVFRTSNMSLEFDSYFDFQVRNIDLKKSELSRVHIKINNGIVEISYPTIK